MMNNKYNITLSKKMVNDYCTNLTNEFFKLLPIFEGQDVITKKIIYSPEVAYEHFQKHAISLTNEIVGGFKIFDDNINFLRLLANLEGIRYVQIREHEKLKSLVFHCIDICKKMRSGSE